MYVCVHINRRIYTEFSGFTYLYFWDAKLLNPNPKKLNSKFKASINIWRAKDRDLRLNHKGEA